MRLRNFISTALTATLLFSAAPAFSQVTFTGLDKEVITITPEKNTGLDAIYVLYDTASAEMQYTASSSPVTISRYSSLGGGFAEEVPDVTHSGNVYTVSQLQGDMGYIIDDGSRRTCIWVVNYKPHTMTLQSISPAAEQQCYQTVLNVQGSADAIHYFTVNGQQRTLSRDIKVSYDTQVWNDEATAYDQVESTVSYESLTPELYITPPVYCRTYFHITGDRFLEEWGMGVEASSEQFEPNAVAVQTTAEQDSPSEDDEENSNQIGGDTEGLGGSAPADIHFRSFCTDAVMHYEWQMADDEEFENITYRITDRDLDYTFTEEGTVYVRFAGSNADGSCEEIGETYTVSIGASELKCPNAFSPGASEGVNDEWKVSYKSLIDFECWIFDRYGNQLCHFTDPSQGWDGKRGGKVVKSGVYFYVIQATGSDGKKYKKSGDINVLNYKLTGGDNGTTDPVE